MKNRELSKRTEITGLLNKYTYFYEEYKILKKHKYNVNGDYIYVVASIYLKNIKQEVGQLIRNYSYINIHENLDSFLSVNLSMIPNMQVYFINLKDYPKMTTDEIVQDIKTNHKDHNFYIDKIPQSL